MLKKITIAILGLTASGFAFTGTMGLICTPSNVTVPCATKQWDLGVQALYLRSSYSSDRAYAVNALGNYKDVSNKWGWGFALQSSYHFSTGNDLSLNWMHYDVSGQPQGPFVNATPLGADSYSLKNTNRFDQVNLVFGQRVNMGLLETTRFYSGLQLADLHADQLRQYQLPAIASLLGITGIQAHDNADFNGIGPVIGVDYAYNLNHGLSLTANTAGSILYGIAHNNSGFAYAPAGLVPISSYAQNYMMVPSLEGKLGLNYAYSIAQGTLNIAGGYQAINYFRILTAATPTTVANSDFGLYGPYLGLNWVG